MTNFIKLSLSFKGDRKYIHGTDVISGFISQINDFNNNISVQFHELLNSSVVLVETSYVELSNFKKANNISGLITYKNKHDAEMVFALLQNKSKDICERHEYNEIAVTDGFIIDGDKISQNCKKCGPFIERVVFLYKVLLNKLFPGFSWVFVKLDASCYYENALNISIGLTSVIGDRMFKAEILVDNLFAGSLVFMKGKK
jgi:hypothetical protein